MAAMREARTMRHPPWNASTTETSTSRSPRPALKQVTIPPPGSAAIVDLQSLRETSSWIRDDLDPLIAREGPDVMFPDDVLHLHELLQALQFYRLNKGDMAFSRIHYAVIEIAGKSSRWPHRLVEECDKIIDQWQQDHGPLEAIRAPLFGLDGRLFGICRPSDLTRDALIERWKREDPSLVDDARAYTNNHAKYRPGQWWINAMFAFRDGIIDSKSTGGGVVHDDESAYAVVLKGDDEMDGAGEDGFTYRSRPQCPGRYRLASATYKSRHPIRVLRAQSLASFSAPRAGIRYDGLYTVTGWSITNKDPDAKPFDKIEYHIHFKREPGQTALSEIQAIPRAEEVDDYREFKRLRQLQRDYLRYEAIAKLSGSSPPSMAMLERQATAKLPTATPTFYRYKDGQIVFPESPVKEASAPSSRKDSYRSLRPRTRKASMPGPPMPIKLARRASATLDITPHSAAILRSTSSIVPGVIPESEPDFEQAQQGEAVGNDKPPSPDVIKDGSTIEIFETDASSDCPPSSPSSRLSTPTRWKMGQRFSASGRRASMALAENAARRRSRLSRDWSDRTRVSFSVDDRDGSKSTEKNTSTMATSSIRDSTPSPRQRVTLDSTPSPAPSSSQLTSTWEEPPAQTSDEPASVSSSALPATAPTARAASSLSRRVPGSFEGSTEDEEEAAATPSKGKQPARADSQAPSAGASSVFKRPNFFPFSRLLDGALEMRSPGSSPSRLSRGSSVLSRHSGRTKGGKEAAGPRENISPKSLSRRIVHTTHEQVKRVGGGDGAVVVAAKQGEVEGGQERPVFRDVAWGLGNRQDAEAPGPAAVSPRSLADKTSAPKAAGRRQSRRRSLDRAAVARGLFEITLRQRQASDLYLGSKSAADTAGEEGDAAAVARLAVQFLSCLRLVWDQLVDAEYVDLAAVTMAMGQQQQQDAAPSMAAGSHLDGTQTVDDDGGGGSSGKETLAELGERLASFSTDGLTTALDAQAFDQSLLHAPAELLARPLTSAVSAALDRVGTGAYTGQGPSTAARGGASSPRCLLDTAPGRSTPNNNDRDALARVIPVDVDGAGDSSRYHFDVTGAGRAGGQERLDWAALRAFHRRERRRRARRVREVVTEREEVEAGIDPFDIVDRVER